MMRLKEDESIKDQEENFRLETMMIESTQAESAADETADEEGELAEDSASSNLERFTNSEIDHYIIHELPKYGKKGSKRYKSLKDV